MVTQDEIDQLLKGYSDKAREQIQNARKSVFRGMPIAQERIELERELHALQRAAQEYPHEVAAAGAIAEAGASAEGKRLLSASKALTKAEANQEPVTAGAADPRRFHPMEQLEVN